MSTTDLAAQIFQTCQGCGQSLILCDADWWTDHRPCEPEQVEG